MSKANSNEKALEKLVALALETHIFGGRKKLQKSDINFNETSDSEKVISLGSKKIINPELIAPFYVYKRQAITLCSLHSIFYSKFYLVAEDKFDMIEEKLTEIGNAFSNYSAWFIKNYVDNINSWAEDHPTWREKIIRSAPPLSYVEESLGFEFFKYKIDATSFKFSKTDKTNGFKSNVEIGLGEMLLNEISEESMEVFKHFINGGSLSTKTLSPLERIRDKLNSLSFVDNMIIPVLDVVSSTIDSLRSKSSFTISDTTMMLALVNMLTDPVKLMAVGSSQATVDSLFSESFGVDANNVSKTSVNSKTIEESFF